MDGNKYFLDTNIVVESLRGNTNVVAYLKKNKNFVIPAIVFGELNFGVENAKQFKKHTKQLKDFTADVEIVKIVGDTKNSLGK
jgi:predicted nucleic acid-binding protein